MFSADLVWRLLVLATTLEPVVGESCVSDIALSFSSITISVTNMIINIKCTELSNALPDEVFFPPTAIGATGPGGAYTELNNARWSNTSKLNPSCVFRPSSVNNLAQAVKILTATALNGNTGAACQVAIKSGGHMPIPGANDIDDGISIDMSWLNKTVLSDDKSVISLGSGAKWIEAYRVADGQGVAFPGGLCGATGVGGLSLGGGQSLFQPKVGWVVDNIINYEVILVTGDIVNANQTDNSDLFRALKGGSSNFGIITQVDIATFQSSNQIWAGQIIVPIMNETVEQTLLALSNYTTQNNININTGGQIMFAYSSDGPGLIDIGIASTDGTVNPDILQPFMSLQPQIQNTVSQRPMVDFIEELDNVQPDGYRYVTSHSNFYN